MSTAIRRSALLFYSAEQIYDLINDVMAYPQFVDYCVASEVLAQSEAEMLASISLQRAGISLSFTTRNRLNYPTEIEMVLEDGPFSEFSGRWTLLPLREGACKVSLELDFVMENAIAGKLAGGLLESVSHALVDAFCRRADTVYH